MKFKKNSSNEKVEKTRPIQSLNIIRLTRLRKRSIEKRSKQEKDIQWIEQPKTKLGYLVKQGKIRSLEQIYLHCIAIKEYKIADFMIGSSLQAHVWNPVRVHKQTCAGQRVRFKAFALVGDFNGHVGFGVKSAKEFDGAKYGSINLAKMNLVPVRRGYWGNKIGKPHTIPAKVSGKCGSVLVRLVPAPRGAGIVAANNAKKVLQFAGIEDIYTFTKGHTSTLGNFIRATYVALINTYRFKTPDLWICTDPQQTPFQEWTAMLQEWTSTSK
eukprot:gnl/MRDRNA2_/MRDRNA2_84179_c0_seq1.p1 gnl/MRDRNA2_/MRDRNA2_84179_c0~~gnl/MRDRNA2_/MRDRNA2_84179_c0_seq1.p1  ORF type:complete len:270 (-),score=5.34 gnl/MRDRNA2_/MRDRNA2_84179_c0_seq1:45-854(-)